MIAFRSGNLQVNLLLNRASPWCDVHSYIPCEGRVDVKLKTDCDRLLIRVPEWVEGGSAVVRYEVNGRSQPVGWQQRFVHAGGVRAGSRVTVRFPIGERIVHTTIGNAPYRLEIRGNTVIAIDPPGRNGPLYERAYYRQPVRWRKVDRFVPEKMIQW
jgi:hypothetical protein